MFVTFYRYNRDYNGHLARNELQLLFATFRVFSETFETFAFLKMQLLSILGETLGCPNYNK